MRIAYKFTNTDSEKDNNINDNFIKNLLSSSKFSFGVDNLRSIGSYKLLGWLYDFKDILTKYVVKQNGCLYEIYGINKTDVRKYCGNGIDYIIEVE